MSDKCRSCGEAIHWVTTRNNKKMPCNIEVLKYDDLLEGDVIVTESGVLYRKTNSQRLPNVKGYISHFATCQAADQFRRGK